MSKFNTKRTLGNDTTHLTNKHLLITPRKIEEKTVYRICRHRRQTMK